MLTISFLALLALGQAGIGLVLYLESRRTKRTDQKLFASLSLLFVIWTSAVGFLSGIDAAANVDNIANYRIANQLAFLSTSLILVNLLVFTQYYPNKRQSGIVTKVLMVLGPMITIASPTPFIAGRMSLSGDTLVYNYGIGILIVVAYALAIIVEIFINGHRSKHSTNSDEIRKQTDVLLKGMAFTVTHILFFVVLLPSLIGQSPVLYAIGYAGPYYLVLYTTYGLLQLKLFDIRLIVARTAGYLLTILVLSCLYGFFVFGVLSILFDQKLLLSSQIFLSIATGIAALSFHSIKRYFDKRTSHIFYQDAYDTEALFNEFNKAIVSTIDLDLLISRATSVIADYLKIEFCQVGIKTGSKQVYRILGIGKKDFVVKDIAAIGHYATRIHQAVIRQDNLPANNSQLQDILTKYDIAILVRLSTNLKKSQEDSGYLIFGSKKSGNPYTGQDTMVAETLANELIIALQNALRFEEIELFNETLQEKVDGATRQLRDANKRLKQLNDSKDDFIGMASHQLRTPLTSIKGYISLVMDGDAGPVNDVQRKMLLQSFTSAQRMVNLVSDLLNVSRLKTGKFVIEKIPTDLSKLITDELEQLKEEAASRGLELTFKTPADFPVLPFDETKTRQVIMNFLDNAIYYTPSGGHITAELKNLSKSVEFRVTDDGIGVPKVERHHLFSKFYRAKNAQRQRPDGTGLGLYMAQKVVTAQGGAIIFNSEENKGSTFGFSFPKDLATKDVVSSSRNRT